MSSVFYYVYKNKNLYIYWLLRNEFICQYKGYNLFNTLTQVEKIKSQLITFYNNSVRYVHIL